jgi:hypothetical protein
MLNYLKKFTMDILPSVAATIIGAYIVNHYIVSKPGANAPVAAAVSTADLKPDHKATAYSKPVEKPTEVSNLPEAGVKAKGMSERTLLERSAAEKAVVIEKPQDKAQEKAKAEAKSADAKPADAPAETASISAEPRRHAPAPREKTAVRVVLPSPVQPITPAVAPAPVAVTPNPAPPVEAAVAPDEHRDANDLARAAIERLRGSSDNVPRAQQVARTPDAPRAPEVVAGVLDTPRVVTAPALRPLPPPIMVSTPASPAGDALDQGAQPNPPYAGISDPRRPTPPADIPLVRPPLDLRAEAAEPMAKEHTTVADDMLSAAKSVFHAVLPK